jgi:uncharacterized protein (DUF58 family)
LVPTPRLLAILLATSPLAILPLVSEPAWIALLACWAVIGLAIGADLAILRGARLEARLIKPSHTGVGGAIRAKAVFDLRSALPLRASLRAIAEEPVRAGGALAVRIPTGSSEVPLELHAEHRGTGALSEMWMRLVGPLGLFARIERTTEGAGSIAVVPDVERVDRTTMEVLGAQPLLSGLKREKWTGEGGEFESLQQYTLGMDLGAVDWKASARHQQLRVRRFHVERRQRIVVCLDTGRAMRDPIDGLERLDHAVHTALVLAKTALRAGDLVGLHAYGPDPTAWVPPRSGAAQFARLRQACASLRAEPDETNHVLGLHDLLRRLHRRSMVVVFTEFSDATTAELMLDALGQLAHRHVIVFVALDDPLLEEPMAAAPGDAPALAAAVVASSLAQRRHLVLARLPRLGIHVVHTRPGGIAAELVERYVKIKKRGLIG